MNYTLRRALPSVLCCLASLVPLSAAYAGDAFIDRDGRTFTVLIDGNATTRTPDVDIKDATSVAPYTVQWSASVEQGPRCFRITPKDARLGEPEKIDVLIHEVQPDKPFNSWRDYSAVPSTLENTATFLKGDGFCVDEYTLTDRIRFPTLPAGRYVVMISFWGKGNWDRQTILLTVAKSGSQNVESAAASALAPAAVPPSECSIEYAAKRTMNLHQQLEDKVATGEANRDVFSRFGADTQDFGELYASNVAEVCRRLEVMKNKYNLK